MKLKISIAAFAVAFCFLVATKSPAADATLKMAEKPVPKEVGETIRAVLQPKAVQLVKGDKASIEFWLRQEVPLKSKPVSLNDTLGAVGETTLLGVISVNDGTLRDYKDSEIPKGIYTARFGLQPKDGDHLGTAEFEFFVVLIAAGNDRELGGLDKFRPMIKASGKSTSSGHPLVLSLRPASGDGSSPRLIEPAPDHKAIRLRWVAKAAGGEVSNLIFDLVYSGHGHIQ